MGPILNRVAQHPTRRLRSVNGNISPDQVIGEMDKSKIARDAEMKALKKLFSRGPCKSSGRRYILEFEDRKPVFRPDEISLAIEHAIKEAFGPKHDSGDEIVPQKLAGRVRNGS